MLDENGQTKEKKGKISHFWEKRIVQKVKINIYGCYGDLLFLRKGVDYTVGALNDQRLPIRHVRCNMYVKRKYDFFFFEVLFLFWPRSLLTQKTLANLY